MSGITRRDLVIGIAGTTGTAVAAPALAMANDTLPESENESTEMISCTPAWYAEMGGSFMSLDELNMKRHELVDSAGDMTLEDGTYVPALWNKVHALIDTYGQGLGRSKFAAGQFDFLRATFKTEENARAFLEMPYGIQFTPNDFAASSGRDEAECAQICRDLAQLGVLIHINRAGVDYYHHLAYAHGFFEFGVLNNRLKEPDWIANVGNVRIGQDFYLTGGGTGVNAGHPFFYSMPCDRSAVRDGAILPFDDYEALIDRNTIFAIAPCQCNMTHMTVAGEQVPDVNGDDAFENMTVDFEDGATFNVERCMAFGEIAEYYIENGMGRQITQEEARAYIKRSVEQGCILQSSYTAEHEVICCCNYRYCLILSSYLALSEQEKADSSSLRNYTHYTLEHDREACIKCGACAARCGCNGITMDEDGYPAVTGLCIRCGQCALVCPVEARKLVPLDPDEYIPLRRNFVDDYNLHGAYRFDHNMIM